MSELRQRAREISREFLRDTFHADGSGTNMDNALQDALLRFGAECMQAEPDEGMVKAIVAKESYWDMPLGNGQMVSRRGLGWPSWSDAFRAMAAERVAQLKGEK